MSFFKKEAPVYVVLDVGSASVGGALLECLPAPKLLFAIREDLPIREDFDKVRFLNDILAAERKVLAELAKHGRSPRTIHVIVSSPWYVGQSRTRLERKNEPFTVSKDLLGRLQKDELALFEKETATLHPSIFGSGYEVLEMRNTSIKVNGYRTNHPVGEKGKSIELSFFVSLVSKEIKNLIKESATGMWHHAKVIFHSHPVAITHVLETLYPGPSSYLIFDVLGEVSDILLVDEHTVKDTASIPLGSHVLVRNLTTALQTLPADILALIHAGNENQLSPGRREQFNTQIDLFRKNWIENLSKVFDTLSREVLLPAKAYLVGSNDIALLFATFLASEELKKYSVSGTPLDVVHINTESVCQFCDVGPGKGDPLLGLEGLYISRVIQTSSGGS